MPERIQGLVKWFSEERGIGFIVLEDGQDIFVHSSNIQEKSTLKRGDLVEFEIVEGQKGLRAANVTITSEE